MSRLESGSVHVREDPCDIQDVIGAALEQLGSAAAPERIEATVDPQLPLVRMDFVLIVQVIANLLDNALKYSPQEKPIRIDARAEDGALKVSVSDQGDGIADSDLSLAFEKFNRGERSGETGGIGLGLSICRGLMEAHRGTIRITRRQPRGTEVSFTLPLRLMEKGC